MRTIRSPRTSVTVPTSRRPSPRSTSTVTASDLGEEDGFGLLTGQQPAQHAVADGPLGQGVRVDRHTLVRLVGVARCGDVQPLAKERAGGVAEERMEVGEG